MSDKHTVPLSAVKEIPKPPKPPKEKPGKPEYVLDGNTATFEFPGREKGDAPLQVFALVENNALVLFPKRSASHRLLLQKLGLE